MGIIVLIFFIQSVPALSIGGFSGDSGISISSSTSLVSTVPTTGPTTGSQVSGQSAGTTQDIPPAHWQLGVRDGTFYDPLSKTSWVYDTILRKFYSPDKGWFLIVEYTGNPPKLIRQYYYDPKNVVLIDMMTGESLNIDQNGMYEPPSPTSTPQPSQQSSSTSVSMTSLTGQSGVSGSCLVPCSDCPSGSCMDCNQDGICDDVETSAGNTGGQSENPQVNPQPTTTPSSGGGISETPQTKVYPLVMEIPGCEILNCSKCFGQFCYDCNNDQICDDPQPNGTDYVPIRKII